MTRETFLQFIKGFEELTDCQVCEEVWNFGKFREVALVRKFPEPIGKITVCSSSYPAREFNPMVENPYTQKLFFSRVLKLYSQLERMDREVRKKLAKNWVWNPAMIDLEHPNYFIRKFHRAGRKIKRWLR